MAAIRPCSTGSTVRASNVTRQICSYEATVVSTHTHTHTHYQPCSFARTWVCLWTLNKHRLPSAIKYAACHSAISSVCSLHTLLFFTAPDRTHRQSFLPLVLQLFAFSCRVLGNLFTSRLQCVFCSALSTYWSKFPVFLSAAASFSPDEISCEWAPCGARKRTYLKERPRR